MWKKEYKSCQHMEGMYAIENVNRYSFPYVPQNGTIQLKRKQRFLVFFHIQDIGRG